ncbi:MAG: SemiSWEET family transporter [Syntrophales bacterium]
MNIADVVGLFAAGLGTIATAPQVIKVYRTKNTQDLSLGTFGMVTGTLFLWFIYGLMVHSLPITIGNALGFSFNLYIVIMKIKLG